jgi:hypothetical protein
VVFISCGARREKAELIQLSTAVEKTRPQGQKLLERFDALRLMKSEEPKKFAETMGQLVLDIDEFLAPVRKIEIKSKKVDNLRGEYLLIWISLQNAMRMSLEVMAVRDPRLAATLDERLMQQNRNFQAALQRFDSDYAIMMKRYGITYKDLGMSPPPPQPAPISFTPSNAPF